MPKKIDYVILPTPGADQAEETATEEVDASRPSRSPRRPRGGGGPRPAGVGTARTAGTSYRGPGSGGAQGPGGFRRPGGPVGRPGDGRGPGGQRPRGFGGMSRMAQIERPTPKVELPPYMSVKE